METIQDVFAVFGKCVEVSVIIANKDPAISVSLDIEGKRYVFRKYFYGNRLDYDEGTIISLVIAEVKPLVIKTFYREKERAIGKALHSINLRKQAALREAPEKDGQQSAIA